MKTRLAGVTLCSLLAFGLAACGGDDTADRTADTPATTPPATTTPAPATGDPALAGALPAGVTQQMVDQGRQIFNGQGICFTCHGQNGTGGPLGPALNDQQWIHLTSGDLNEIENIIRTGVQRPQQYQSPMPAMGGAQLNDEQVRAVSSYVYAISHGVAAN
jgi:mono/diheme cytochrome c family protein